MLENIKKIHYNINEDEKLQEQLHCLSPRVGPGVTPLAVDESSVGLHMLCNAMQK